VGAGELPAEIDSRRIRSVTTGGGTTPTFRPFTTNEAERYQPLLQDGLVLLICDHIYRVVGVKIDAIE
jgi:hypothetical protein